MMELNDLRDLLTSMGGARVLAVGDVMVDRFVYGEVSRVSPEAPIPILARRRETVMLGAAGNVARNVAALGGAVVLAGVVGEDDAGHQALALVGAENRIEGRLAIEPARPTTLKTRFICGGQQLLRVDVEEAQPVGGAVERRLVRTIAEASVGMGAILLSDYGKGVATPAVIAACLAAAKTQGVVFMVDSKARAFGRYGAATIVKPNAAELAYATDLPTDSDDEIEAALAKALAMSACGAILVTRGAKGLALAVRGEAVRRHRGSPAEVFDASGAGDTVLAAVGLALAAGASLEAALDLALLAAGVAVRKTGTATVSPDELEEASRGATGPSDAKIVPLDRMAREAARWRERGLKIGFTNGCFDILHPGHVGYLGEARGWCDKLIVGLNTDRSVRAIKGEGRPVNPLEARAVVLAGLACVDLVVPFDDDTPLGLIEAARPDLLVKGGDYLAGEVVGGDLVTAWGGKVRIAAFAPGHSTTATLAKIPMAGLREKP